MLAPTLLVLAFHLPIFFTGQCGFCPNAESPALAPAPAPAATTSLPIVLQANSPNGVSNASAADVEAAVASILGISKLPPSPDHFNIDVPL